MIEDSLAVQRNLSGGVLHMWRVNKITLSEQASHKLLPPRLIWAISGKNMQSTNMAKEQKHGKKKHKNGKKHTKMAKIKHLCPSMRGIRNPHLDQDYGDAAENKEQMNL